MVYCQMSLIKMSLLVDGQELCVDKELARQFL